MIVEELPKETICTLSQEVLIDYPYSMEVLSDSLFAIATSDKVFLFDYSGRIVREIGHEGRARGEYSFPMNIRRGSPGEIIVWSANSLKFLRFDLEGNFLADYPYDSAVRDFIYWNNFLYIYTAGVRSGNMIDIYDLSKATPEGMDANVTKYHKLLSSLISSVPLCVSDGQVFYAPKDAPQIRMLPSGKEVIKFKTTSFHVPDMGLSGDRKQRNLFYAKSSYNIGLLVSGNEFRLLACEGESMIMGDRLDGSTRMLTVYSSTGPARHFRAGDMRFSTLSLYKGKFFFLSQKEENGEDVYYLNQFVQ